MGQPVKIMDIAKRMIEMSGGGPKSSRNPDGIEIVMTGLRPGEKLFEALLIDASSLLVTPHEKILRADEKKLSQIEIVRIIKDLETAITASSGANVRDILSRPERLLGLNDRTEDYRESREA